MSNKANKTALPKLRFPEFQSEGEWEIKQLGSVAKLIKEKTGAKRYKLMSITSGLGLVSQMEKFGREIAGESYKNYYVIRKDDFAYNKSSTKLDPEGQIALLENEDAGAVPNSIFTCFRVDEKRVSPYFLKYPFANNVHGEWLRNFIQVGARANGALAVDNKDLLALPLAIPSLPEQQKIAATLSSLDDLITAQSAKLEALQAHKRGLMQELFPAEGETVPKLRFPEFRNAREWVEKKLGEVAYYENGKAHEQHIADDGKFIIVNSKFVSTEGAVKKFSGNAFCLAKKNDVLMVLSDLPKGKALAKCFLVDADVKYTVNQRVCKLTAKDTVAMMLFYILNRNTYFLALDDGITQTHIRKDEVLNCPLLLPKQKEEQQKIADCLSSLDALITAQSQKIDALKLHKKGLMQALFPAASEQDA